MTRGRSAAKTQQTDRVYLLRWQDDPLWAQITRGLLRACRTRNDEDAVVIDLQLSVKRFVDALDHLPAEVRGIVIQPREDAACVRALERVMQRGVRVVQVVYALETLDAPSVRQDDYVGAYEATSHLLERHNLPVHHLGFGQAVSSVRLRHRGWADAMASHGFGDWTPYFMDMGVNADHSTPIGSLHGQVYLKEGYQRARELFARHPGRRHSIFCVGDLSAMSVYEAAREMGVAIGRDAFVAGFGNYPVCTRLDPPLTSVEADRAALGFEAANLVLDALEGQSSAAIHTVLPVTLMKRASSEPTGETGDP